MNIPSCKGLVGLNMSARRLGLAYRPCWRRMHPQRLIYAHTFTAEQSPTEVLAAAVKEHRLHDCFCVDAIPFSWCHMQVVSLPRLHDTELIKLTQQHAFWQENMQVDKHSHCLWWQKLAHHQAHEIHVLLVAIPLAALTERVQTIRRAGLRWRRLSLSCFDYCDLADFRAGFCLLVLDDDDPVCLAVTERGIELRPAEQLRDSLLPAAAAEQTLEQASISQCSQLIRQLFVASPLKHLRVVGMQNEQQQARLAEWQALFPHCTIELHAPLTLCKGWGSNFVDARAAMRARQPRRLFFSSAPINVQSAPPSRLGRRWQCMAALWLLATVVVVAALMYWDALSQGDLSQWQESKSSYQSSLDTKKEIEEQLRVNSKELQRQHAYLQQFDNIKQARRRLPILLAAFEESVPQGVWLSQVHSLESGRVKIHGTAVNDGLTHAFVNNLSVRLHPLLVDMENARFSDNEGKSLRQFVLTVRIVGGVDSAARPSHATRRVQR